MFHRGIYRLALFLTGWTFLVVTLGATVKSKEAGLVIAEPFVFRWIDTALHSPNFAAEYFHRMFVGILGCGVVALMIWMLTSETRGAVRKLAVAAFVLVIVQGVFGWATVNYLTKWWVSAPHAALGQTLLCLLALLATMCSRAWTGAAQPEFASETPSLRRLANYCVAALFVQTVLGALVRHDAQGEALRNGDEAIFWALLSAHILGAAAVLYCETRLLLRIFTVHAHMKVLVRPAQVLAALLGLQLLFGPLAAVLKYMMSQTFEQANDPPTARVLVANLHLMVGAAMFAISTVVAARAYRYTAVAQASSLPGCRQDACATSEASA